MLAASISLQNSQGTHYLLGMEELTIRPNSDLVNDSGLQVHKHGPGHVLARPGLRKECGVGVIPAARRLVRGHGAIGADPVLEAVQLPAGVTYLAAGLADVD